MQICFVMIQKLQKTGELAGDPTETALTDMGFSLRYGKDIIENNERKEELPFDSERKLMTTVNEVRRQIYCIYKRWSRRGFS